MKFVVVIVCVLTSVVSLSQSVEISGTVTGEGESVLPFAHLMIVPDSITSITDNKGRYKFVVSPGLKKIIVSYVGYENTAKIFSADKSTTIDLLMRPKISKLEEVVITSKIQPQVQFFNSTRSSMNSISSKDVFSTPTIVGEPDPIKVLQLLPGTIRGVEGSSDLFVRGGAADQNLILFDEATVYNSSHLFGFVSVFNPDILDSVYSINGAFPAQYGGRLSSILRIDTHADIANKTKVSGGIGLIGSRLYVEQPIIKNKLSVWVAGRRTYIDQILEKFTSERLPYYFYDINTKAILNLKKLGKLSYSYYNGKDITDMNSKSKRNSATSSTKVNSGNDSHTFKWDRHLSGGWDSEIALSYTNFKHQVTSQIAENRIHSLSNIRDIKTHISLVKHYPSETKDVLRVGIDWINHKVSPSIVSTRGVVSEVISSSNQDGRFANEVAFYGHYGRNLNKKWLVNAGIRYSMGLVEGKSYMNPEPRISARYSISKNRALKLSYSRMVQYISRISSSAISTPGDVWYPVTTKVKPQTSHQFTVALHQIIPSKEIFISLESYYKSMDNLLGLREGTNILLNVDFEPNIVQGTGQAYGLEFLLRKNAGKLAGWLSYTLSWSFRKFDEINRGKWYRARYDRRHNVSLVTRYQLSKRLELSAVFEFISGSRFTPVIGQYGVLSPSVTGIDLIPVYSSMNEVKLGDTHRLDLGLKFSSHPYKKFQYEWRLGIYNIYNRASPFAINIARNKEGTLEYQQPGIFGLLPYISYGFKF